MIVFGIMPWTWGIPWWGWLIITLIILGAGGGERSDKYTQRQKELDRQIEEELSAYRPAVTSLKAGFIIGLFSYIVVAGFGLYIYAHHHHGWGWALMIIGVLCFWGGLSLAVPQGTPPDQLSRD